LPSDAELQAKLMDKMPEHIRKFWQRDRPIEFRPVQFRDYLNPEKQPPVQNLWFRATSTPSTDRALNQCILAYASDMTLIDTCLLPHGRSFLDRDLQLASLDHAMWFHRSFQFDDWMLYAHDSPSASGSRGFNRGSIYDRSGRLIASVAQEGLIRQRT
jgi:acyl-CoA thioesterase II